MKDTGRHTSRSGEILVHLSEETEEIIVNLSRERIPVDTSYNTILTLGMQSLLGEPVDTDIVVRSPSQELDHRRKKLEDLLIKLQEGREAYDEVKQVYSEYLRDEEIVDHATEAILEEIEEMVDLLRKKQSGEDHGRRDAA